MTTTGPNDPTTHSANTVIEEAKQIELDPGPQVFYIAGCVTDGGRISEEGYVRKFSDAEMAVRTLGHVPVNPTTLPHNHQRRWRDYMIEALHVLLDCDGVYVLPCWRRSKGATIEVQLAMRLGKTIIFEHCREGGS